MGGATCLLAIPALGEAEITVSRLSVQSASLPVELSFKKQGPGTEVPHPTLTSDTRTPPRVNRHPQQREDKQLMFFFQFIFKFCQFFNLVVDCILGKKCNLKKQNHIYFYRKD